MKKILKVTALLAILWPLLSVFFAIMTLTIYTRLNDEKPIITIYFEKNSPQVFEAYLTNENTKNMHKYKIFGDQWRIDAQFIKIKPWANILGLDAHYNLERLEGRYENIKEQNTKKNTAYDLSSNSAIGLPQFLIDYNFIVDAKYGSSTYKEIEPNMLYTVFRTQYGLLIRNKPILHKNKEKQSFLSELFN